VGGGNFKAWQIPGRIHARSVFSTGLLERSAGQMNAGDRELAQARALLDRILGEFKNAELKKTFRGVKEVCDLLTDPG
jgi:hypothetical protein